MTVATTLPSAPTSAPGSVSDRSGGRPRPSPGRAPRFGPVGAPHRSRASDPPLRLTRRGIVASWVAAVATVAIAGFGLVEGAQPAAPGVETTQVVTVRPGHTLWGIAESVNPGVDPRVTMEGIRDANGLGSSSLVTPGTELLVPVYGVDR